MFKSISTFSIEITLISTHQFILVVDDCHHPVEREDLVFEVVKDEVLLFEGGGQNRLVSRTQSPAGSQSGEEKEKDYKAEFHFVLDEVLIKEW